MRFAELLKLGSGRKIIGKVMTVNNINKVDGFVGNSQSKYFSYATEEIKKAGGTIIKTATSKGGRKESMVADDKQALWNSAKDYAGKKQSLRSGEFIAFEVIKRDVKSGVVTV